ncbi:MAG TPA: hypothetical protein PK397_13755 [Ignavibacteriaceae bacterium]|nr:hypothetical protein [Ignavibacteriaceae bacterium]
MRHNYSRMVARALSTLFIPPTNLLIVMLLFAFSVEENYSSTYKLIAVSAVFGVIIPIAVFIYLLKKKKVINQDAVIKEERTIPYVIGLFLYVTGFLLLYNSVTLISLSFWFSYISNMMIILLINKYWKISAHALGIAGPFAAAFYVFGISALPYFLIVLLVGWSRIKLNCHTPAQVLAGTIFGVASVYFQMLLINRLF